VLMPAPLASDEKRLMWEGSRRDLLGTLFWKPGLDFAAVAGEGELAYFQYVLDLCL